MITREELRKLAQVKTSPAPLLSCYLNCDQTDEKQLEKSRIFLKNFLSESEKISPQDPAVKKSFKQDKEKIEKEFEGIMPDTASRGLIVFACGKKGLWKSLRSPVLIKNQGRLSDACFLLPLLKINEELLRSVFVRLDPKESEIIVERQGQVEARKKVEQYFPDRVDTGGWSQMRFQRHVQKHLERNLKGIYQELKEMTKEKRIGYLFLIGEKELRREFEKKLTPAFKDIKQEGFTISPSAEWEDIFDRASQRIKKQEKKEEGKIIKTILDSQKGRSTLGNVLRAVNRKKVELLAIEEDYSKRAFQCSKSGLLFAEKGDCPGRSERLREVELEVELVRQALLQDANIEVVSENDQFKKQGGLGVIVRY